jgi:hypothetical protein
MPHFYGDGRLNSQTLNLNLTMVVICGRQKPKFARGGELRIQHDFATHMRA